MKLRNKLASSLIALSTLSANVFAGDSPYVFARAWVSDAKGMVNSRIDVKAKHQMFISNPSTDHAMTYEWIYELCTTHRCYHKIFNRTLQPGETYTEFNETKDSVSFDTEGTFDLIAKTTVNGEYKEFEQQRAKIRVYKD